MRFINVREFLRDFRKEIKNLPFVITRYGKPTAVVIPWEDWNKAGKESEIKFEDLEFEEGIDLTLLLQQRSFIM